DDEQRRRTLYVFAQRSLLPPLLTTFDLADSTLPCGQRDVTTVAPQALALLNNDFSHQQSRSLAERVARSAGPDPQDQITWTWRLALGRLPDAAERTLAAAHLGHQAARFAGGASSDEAPRRALESLCHVLLCSNEFLYLD
ncbi:MAG: DUF1553 domain-containing protein, partial [Pirellulaceae bacterium]|nr:DUF1553 domain-containing protein [Pirellulaceae bacterium]